jgi:hypothetical protein
MGNESSSDARLGGYHHNTATARWTHFKVGYITMLRIANNL